ncbi:MAG TPA: MarR family winged helix-turn-helix transcriptional regulator [Streptosporangiaceae bacterium]|jgi:DNA-binding MarR family transcriptional regulator
MTPVDKDAAGSGAAGTPSASGPTAAGPAGSGVAGSLQWFGLERDRLRSALARQAGISVTDLDALEHLEAAGPLSQRDLGARLNLTSGAVTMLADRLERAGWVRRRPHPRDRRYTLLELTAAAAERTPAGLAGYHAAVQALAAGVPAEHREAIRHFLAAATAAAARAADQIGGR